MLCIGLVLAAQKLLWTCTITVIYSVLAWLRFGTYCVLAEFGLLTVAMLAILQTQCQLSGDVEGSQDLKLSNN